jgi:hypothetical protein
VLIVTEEGDHGRTDFASTGFFYDDNTVVFPQRKQRQHQKQQQDK